MRVHLSQSDVAFRARLELILAEDELFIKTIENSAEDEGEPTADGTITDGGELTHRYCGRIEQRGQNDQAGDHRNDPTAWV